MICKKKAIVFSAGDEETHKAVTVCKDCSIRLGTQTTYDVIQKYGKVGKRAFKGGIKVERGAIAS